MKKIRTLIVGASGLVGGEVLKCVSKENQEIFLLSRRTLGIVQENCSEIISDFDDIDNIDFPEVDHVYISIGKKLGSSELMYIQKSAFDLIMLDPPSFSNSKSMETSFDVERDQEALLNAAMSVLAPDGVLYFSTNRRGFRLSPDIEQRYEVRNISRDTIPMDFERNRDIHQCWRITHGTTRND